MLPVCDYHSLVAELNSMPEKGNLTRPLGINDLDWEAYGSAAGLSTRQINYLRKQARELAPRSMRQAIFMYNELIRNVYPDETVKWSAISCLFRKTQQETRSMYENYQLYKSGQRGKIGRPCLLREEQIQQLYDEISKRFAVKRPMKRSEIQEFIMDSFQVEVSKKWVERLVATSENLIESQAWPMPVSRAEVTTSELAKFYEEFREAMVGIDPDCCFNVDEIGFSRRLNHKPVRCVVPASAEGTRVEYLTTAEAEKTFTAIVAVSLSGDAMRPMIVCPTMSLSNDFLTTKVRQGHDCFLVSNESGFCNRRIFKRWYELVMRPEIDRRRKNMSDKNAPFLILCDGFTGHDDPVLREMMAVDNVRLVFIPPHSSHLTQPLDKFVFANLKAAYFAGSPKETSDDRNGRKLLRILDAFHKAMKPATIRRSWDAVGVHVTWGPDGRISGVLVDGEAVMGSRVDMAPAQRRPKRTRLEAHLVNGAELTRAQEHICPSCGQQLPKPDPPRLIIRLRISPEIRARLQNEEQ